MIYVLTIIAYMGGGKTETFYAGWFGVEELCHAAGPSVADAFATQGQGDIWWDCVAEPLEARGARG